MYVCHRCDTPSCVNPDHFFLGTATDNNADMTQKGRQRGPRGETHHAAKLTAEHVKEIRRDKRLNCEIARGFGVSEATVSLIKNGKTWRHVE